MLDIQLPFPSFMYESVINYMWRRYLHARTSYLQAICTKYEFCFEVQLQPKLASHIRQMISQGTHTLNWNGMSKLTTSLIIVIDNDKRFGAQHLIDWIGEPRKHERIVAQLPLLDWSYLT